MLSNSIVTDFNAFIMNIFLVNYLVAILSTVYTIMIEEGEFSFKSNTYEFIEKYSIPLLDHWGYAELIIHPPPLNLFTLFLLPCIIKKSLMKKTADLFSKMIFWAENFLYIFGFFLYEMILCPYIYAKVTLNIFILA